MDAEAWVAIGFLCFVAGAIYLGAHSRVSAILDARGQRIRAELDEAERLRKEAADLLASFEGKRAQAEREAAELVDQARAEAKLIAETAETHMQDFVKRRTAQAEAKIANAETQALAQVRAAAADAATAAAQIVLRDETRSGLGDKLVEDGIRDVARLAH
jgi:F-type H+-transporting ATPase subunit b